MIQGRNYNYTAGSHLGAVEDELGCMVGRHIMEVSIDAKQFRDASAAALIDVLAVDYTDLFLKLTGNKGSVRNSMLLDLIFTDRSMYRSLQDKLEIKFVKAINQDKSRSGRTIIVVEVEGMDKAMVLKCINRIIKPTDITKKYRREETIMQQEVAAFDSITDDLKRAFVTKYAHGRLWFDTTSYEVILMEKMFSTDLNTAMIQTRFDWDKPDQYVWLARAFGLLHEIHKAGYSHGDANCQNVLWMDGIGKGAMKFIDMERTLNLNSEEYDTVTKTVCKLNDIGTLLLRNSLAEIGKNPRKPIDFNLLHERLIKIKAKLPGPSYINEKNSAFLDDVLPHDDSIKHVGIDALHLKSYVQELKENNPERYEKMSNVEFSETLDEFTLNLSNPQYLKKVFNYTLMEINKSARDVPTVDQDDINIPQYQAVLVTHPSDQNPAQKRMEGPNVFPLKLGEDHISIHDDSSNKLWGIYFEISEDDSVTLLAYNGSEVQTYNGSKIEMIYSRGVPLLSRKSGRNLYFSLNTTTAALSIYENSSTKPDEFELTKKLYSQHWQYHRN
jgi:hypothetical protein